MARYTRDEALRAIMQATTPCLYFVASDYFARPLDIRESPQGTLVTLPLDDDPRLPLLTGDAELIMLVMQVGTQLFKRVAQGFIDLYTAPERWSIPYGPVIRIVWTSSATR